MKKQTFTKMLTHAIERYEEIKSIWFPEGGEEMIFEDGTRLIQDDENELRIEFVEKTCSDSEFKYLHSSTIANIDL